MTEGEEAPTIGITETLTVFHRDIDAVEFAIEKTSTRRLDSRSIGKIGPDVERRDERRRIAPGGI